MKKNSIIRLPVSHQVAQEGCDVILCKLDLCKINLNYFISGPLPVRGGKLWWP